MNTYNFCAGPAMLPAEVMKKAQAEFINWKNLGCSVMEVSHRSKEFIQVAEKAESDFRDLLNINDDYAVLFMHGGGRGQFSAVPLNLATKQTDTANYIVSGSWSKAGAKEAHKFCSPNVVDILKTDNGVVSAAPATDWNLDSNASFTHFCPNETVDGIEINDINGLKAENIVADMSSNILSKPININDYGVIYAGAQKNIGPSGLTMVVVKKSLLTNANNIPCVLDYKLASENGSMFNTPPTFAWYLAGLVFEWLKERGGVSEIAKVNLQKSNLLYDFIDNSDLFYNNIASGNRSKMNVPFHLYNDSLNNQFLADAETNGLLALKGHRSVGGMRASIYNAMPLEGVQALVNFMSAFEKEHK